MQTLAVCIPTGERRVGTSNLKPQTSNLDPRTEV